MFWGRRHLVHGADLHGRHLARRGARTDGAVFKRAILLPLRPRVVARRRQADEAENDRELDAGLGVIDRAQQLCLAVTGWDTVAVQSHPRDTEDAEQQAHDGQQHANAILKPDDLGTEFTGVRVEHIESDHVRHSPPYPTPCRRTRHSQTLGDARVPGVVGEFTQAMVVRASAGVFRHAGRMDGGQRRRKAGRRSRRQDTPKGQQFCTRCICTHETPGCRDPQLGCRSGSAPYSASTSTHGSASRPTTRCWRDSWPSFCLMIHGSPPVRERVRRSVRGRRALPSLPGRGEQGVLGPEMPPSIRLRARQLHGAWSDFHAQSNGPNLFVIAAAHRHH